MGASYVLKGEYVLILNFNASARDRINTLETALKHFDLDRELLDKIPEQQPFNISTS